MNTMEGEDFSVWGRVWWMVGELSICVSFTNKIQIAFVS